MGRLTGAEPIAARRVRSEFSALVHGVPFRLTPSAGSSWNVEVQPASLSVTAPARSDISIDPRSDAQLDAAAPLSSATLMGALPSSSFQLRARVTVEFASTFDAGALLLWMDDRHWPSCGSSCHRPRSR